MRVMHIISGLTNGGAEAVLYRLVTRDPEDEHCVVSMMDDGYYGARLKAHGIDVVTLGMPPGRLSLAGLRELRRTIASRRPDIVQTWMYHADLIGGIVARLASSARVVWGIHHTTHDSREVSLTKRTLTRLCALTSHVVPHRVISCSKEGVAVHARHGYRRDRLVAVHNGYDLEEFSPSSESRSRERTALGVDERTMLFGMVGRWNAQKDHENLLKALEMLRASHPNGWRCVMVGSDVDGGNATLTASRTAKRLEPVLELSGPTDDVPALMNALDVHVLPSAFGEACPNVIAEAMACGTPCVTTDVGDAALMVGDTGWTVPPRDSRALCVALVAAIEAHENAQTWARRQQAATRRVREHFALERMLDGYRAVWRNALPAGTGGGPISDEPTR